MSEYPEWRKKAKELGIKMYRRTKVDVIAEIEERLAAEKPEQMTVSLDTVTVMNLIRKAMKDLAIEKGLDPDKEIKISRFQIRTKRKGVIKLIGEPNDSQSKDNSEESSGSGSESGSEKI